MNPITLPTQRSAPKFTSPKLLVLFGQQKVGKTTKINELENCLIWDTESGTDFLDTMAVKINSLQTFQEYVKAIRASYAAGAPRYDYMALDTVDNIALWNERKICAEYKDPKTGAAAPVKNLIDIPYGAGFGQQRDGVIACINALKSLCTRVIVVGHRKKSMIGEDFTEIGEVTLDLSGKLKNLIMADADAVGYIFRPESGDLMISFKSNGGVDAGARCAHLRNQVIPFEWNKIYLD